MKKLFAILLVALVAATVLVSCTDGKCDECGAPKAELTKEAKDAGLSKEFCEDCMNELLSVGSYDLNECSRVDVIQRIYELEGKPAPEGDRPAYDDVDRRATYANAVIWATENGIVFGYEDGNYYPYNDVTKEQYAAILYRYARYKNLDTSAQTDFSRFEDASKIYENYVDAMKYAVASGFVTPENKTTLDPKGEVLCWKVEEALATFAS